MIDKEKLKEYEKELAKHSEELETSITELKDQIQSQFKDWLDRNITAEAEKKSKAEAGYFDNVTTWKEAIEKMKDFNVLYSGGTFKGHFEVIDNTLYFKMGIPHTTHDISENYLMAHPNYRRKSERIKTAWENINDD